ncbi:UNVERIFIED_CONTAM: hypothetical protein NCL1_10904 [Trichonephila clavipes]
MGCHFPQYMVTSSIDPGHHDSPVQFRQFPTYFHRQSLSRRVGAPNHRTNINNLWCNGEC